MAVLVIYHAPIKYRLTRGGIFQIGPPGRNESGRKSAKMQKKRRTEMFADKMQKLFLLRFMKKYLSVMKVVAVTFEMAPAVSKFASGRFNILVSTIIFQEYV